MDGLIDLGSEFDPSNENYQDYVRKIGKPCKASDDDEDNSSTSPAADSSAVDASSGAALASATARATDLTDEEIHDLHELGVKLKDCDLNSTDEHPIDDLLLPEFRPKANETDVDDIMSDSFSLVGPDVCKSNGESDLKTADMIKKKILSLDDDDDDEDDMKELLRFKRQNSRDYLEQTPIDGLLEGIAEEPEEDGTKEIEEEYDSVVIKDDEEESGSGSEATKDTGKEMEESETAEDQSVVDVVTTDAAAVATATIVDVDGDDNTGEGYVEVSKSSEKQEMIKEESQTVTNGEEILGISDETQVTDACNTPCVDPAVEPMDTTFSPSSSETTSDENVVSLEGRTAIESAKTPTDPPVIIASQSNNKNHDYVNIGILESTTDDLYFGALQAAKAEISDEDFSFGPPEECDELPLKNFEQADTSCDYVNVDTIRANKRLVSRMIQEGNDEEFERLEAEIISKLEDEEDSDYCVPKSNPVEVKPDDSCLRQFSDLNGSNAIDENKNLSLSGHENLINDEDLLKDEKFEDKKSSPLDVLIDDAKPSTTSTVIKNIEEQFDGQAIKENGNIELADNSESEIDQDYKLPKPHKTNSNRDELMMDDRDDINTYLDKITHTDSFGAHPTKKSNLKSDHSRLASPACETSGGGKSNDILPEAGSVKALVAQWQQMESKRWSRKDDMIAQNGDSKENRGMNRSRSCGPLPRKIRVLSPDGVLDDEGRRISDWTVVGGSGDLQEQYNSQASLTRAMLVKFERLDYETSTSAKPPLPAKKTFKWEVKETKTLNRPSFLAH